MRRWLLVLAPALLTLLLGGGAARADTPTAQTFGIQPASATEPDSRGTFSYSVTPGALVKDHVAVWNYGDQPLTLRLYPADAFNTDSGGYDVLPEGKPSTQAGSWVRTAADSLTLPARSRQIVPFTLAVPATASPGDHAAGIVVSLRRESKDAKGNAVTVDQRVGARVQIRVSGALHAELKVLDARAVYHPSLNPLDSGRTTVSYSVRNTGNVRLGGRQAVRVSNLLGSIATGAAPADLQELLPGNTVSYHFDVSGSYPVLWSTAGITVDPLAVGADKDPQLSSTVAKQGFASIPWALLVVLLPFALIGYALRQRRHNRLTGIPALPAPVVAGALLAAALLLGQLPLAPHASAAEAGTLASPADTGTLAFDYETGHDDDAIDVLTSGLCPAAGDYLAVRITGAGFPAEGAPLTGTVAAAAYRRAANGGYVLPLANTLRVVANRSGAGPLHGAYTVTASCRAKVAPTSLRDFTGVLNFGTPTSWQAVTVAPPGVIQEAAADPQTGTAPTAGQTGAAPAGAAPGVRRTAAVRTASSGTPVGSWLVMGAGVLLLGWIGVPYARRRLAGRGAGEDVK
ncbi:WxL protein peptidoglycan domain-containing protein [Kitasatospora kazusensis]